MKLEDLNNLEKMSAWNLWINLPSYQITKKYHGPFVDEFLPIPKIVMDEAMFYIKDNLHPNNHNLNVFPWYQCCCGENHSEKDEYNRDDMK